MNGHFGQNLTNTIDSSQVTMWRPWPGRDNTNIGFILCSLVAISNFPPSCLITSRPNLRSVVWRPEKRTPSHRCLPWPWAGCPAHAVTMSPVSPVLQNMCGGGDRGWVMQTFSGAKTILWLRDKEELWGADSVSCSAFITNPPLSYLNDLGGLGFCLCFRLIPVQQSGRWRDRQHNIYLQKNISVSPLSMFSW